MSSRLWLLLSTGLLLAGCAPQKATQATQPTLSQPVRVVTAVEGVLTSHRFASASLKPAEESLVASEAAGRVEAVLASRGTPVSAGQVVVQLDPTPAQLSLQQAELALQEAKIQLAQAEAQQSGNLLSLSAEVQAAQAAYAAAERRYQEGKQLLAAGGISPLDFKSLQQAKDQARSALANAQNALAQAERAPQESLALLRLQVRSAMVQLAQAERALRETSIRAPFSGTVAQVLVRPGEFVGIGSGVFKLAAAGQPRVHFDLPPEQAAQLPLGTVVSFDYQGVRYPARIVESAQVPGSNGLVSLVAVLEGQNSPPLGAVGELSYTLRLARGLLVPASALQIGSQGPYLFVVEGGVAPAVPITILAQTGKEAAVEGIAPGAQVIDPVPPGLESGEKVEAIR
jgi:HlyD family secretion protein